MPYDSIADLPERIKERFKSTEERRAFKEAFNAAWDGTCKDGGRQGDREACSFAVATQAAKGVKKALAKQEEESVRGLLARIASTLDTVLRGSGLEHGRASATAFQYDEDGSLSFTVEIAKRDDERQIVWGVVLEPETEDAQGDIISADEIQKTAHEFLPEYSAQEAELGLEHVVILNRKSARLVESFTAPVDFTLEKKKVKKGSWVVGAHIVDGELWKSVKAGEFTGFSIAGVGMKVAA